MSEYMVCFSTFSLIDLRLFSIPNRSLVNHQRFSAGYWFPKMAVKVEMKQHSLAPLPLSRSRLKQPVSHSKLVDTFRVDRLDDAQLMRDTKEVGRLTGGSVENAHRYRAA